MKQTFKIFETADQLASTLADEFLIAVNKKTKLNKDSYIVLSGGNTPRLFFRKLSHTPYRKSIPWQYVHFFWGDERCVPPDHPESNYEMTKKNLLDHISIPVTNIHRILGEDDTVAEAKRYAQEIQSVVPNDKSGFPRFDWIFLGLGTDGHTASIFPGSDVLEDRKNICSVAVHSETGQKRITLTLPVINHAKCVIFLVTGESKASLVAKILTEAEESKSLPAFFVKPVNGTLEWRLDRLAGKLI